MLTLRMRKWGRLQWESFTPPNPWGWHMSVGNFLSNGVFYDQIFVQGSLDMGHQREGPLLGGHPVRSFLPPDGSRIILDDRCPPNSLIPERRCFQPQHPGMGLR